MRTLHTTKIHTTRFYLLMVFEQTGFGPETPAVWTDGEKFLAFPTPDDARTQAARIEPNLERYHLEVVDGRTAAARTQPQQ